MWNYNWTLRVSTPIVQTALKCHKLLQLQISTLKNFKFSGQGKITAPLSANVNVLSASATPSLLVPR